MHTHDYICKLCTDGVIISMCPYILLATYSKLPYCLIVCVYLFILHVHVDIHYVWVHALMYGMSVSLHLSSYNIKEYFGICIFYYLMFISPTPPSHSTSTKCLKTRLAGLCSFVSPSLLSLISHFVYVWAFMLVGVLLLSELLLHDGSYGLIDDMLDEAFMCLCSSWLLSLHSNKNIFYPVFGCLSGSCGDCSFSS